MTIIYRGTLPRDFIEAVSGNDKDILDFLIGNWDITEACRWGLQFQLLLGQEDFNTQMVECQVKLIGDDKYATFWLLNWRAKWNK
jgi:hypothetical protein